MLLRLLLSSILRFSCGILCLSSVLLLALCHGIIVEKEGNELVYNTPSPDEIAFVKFCESVNLNLVSRD